MSFILQKIIYPYISNNWLLLFFYTIIVIITYTIGSIGLSKSFTRFLNSNVNNKDMFFVDILNVIKNGSKMGWIYIIIILSLTYCIFTYIKIKFQSKILLDVSEYSRTVSILNIFKHLTEKYEEIEESDISWLVSSSFWSSRLVVRYIFEEVIPFILTFLIISLYLLYYNSFLFTVTIIHFLILVFYIYKTNDKSLVLSEIQDKESRRNNNLVGDKVKNTLNIIFDNTLDRELKDIDENQAHFINSAKNQIKNNTVVLSTSNLINYTYVIFMVVLIYIKKGSITNEIGTVFIMLLLIYITILNAFITETLQITGNVYKLRSLDHLLTNNNDIKCENINNFYKITLINACFKYNDKYVLNNLNITFEPKKINVIMGKSGSGKTTLMKLIIKMYNLNKGDIYLDDYNIKDLCIDDVRNSIYYVNQRTILFNDTVMYNMQYGNNFDSKKIIDLLIKYDLYDYYNLLDDGINTSTGVNGSNLSLGMQKIIMIIRGILKEKKSVLIFDEPLTSLDKETRNKIVKLIINETKNKTVIIISHDEEILPHADNIINLTS